ncbi:MAG: ABC transporter transmembrane domain-containing protein [Sneathiella sp.]
MRKTTLDDDKPMLRHSKMPTIGNTSVDIIVASTALNLLALALPIMILQVYDRIIPNNATETLVLLILGVGAALLLEAFFRLARAYITAFSGAQFEHITGCRALGRTLGTNIARFESEAAGVYLHRFNAIDSLREFMSGSNLLVFVDLPFAVIFIGMVGYIGGTLVIAPLVLLVIFSLVTLVVGKSLRKSLSERSTWEDRRYNFLIEVLTGIHTVKGLALEAQMIRRYERLQETTAGILQKITFQNNIAQGLGAIFSQITLVCVAAFGSILVIDGALTIGGLAACTLLSGRALQPLLRAMGVWTHYQNVKLAKIRVNTLLQLPQSEAPIAVSYKDIQANDETGISLTFENVTFSYNEDESPLFENISATFNTGSTTAVVGANSSGKSTLLWLALGLLPATSGRILLNGKDIRSISRDELHSKIAYLPQNGAIFHGTVMENLTTFRKGSFIDEAIKQSQLLGLDNFIKRLPLGYDTMIGDGAADSLPGGIRQRIAIARALVSKPEIILFDEANTSLDAAGDEILKNTLLRLKGQSTIILISLRPSLLKIADIGFRIKAKNLVQTPVEDLVQFKRPAVQLPIKKKTI